MNESGSESKSEKGDKSDSSGSGSASERYLLHVVIQQKAL